ncbi:MAG: glycosyltransferase [Candidatus Bathyarchaeia archaeon]
MVTVSVVVRTYNSGQVIANCFDSLFRQTSKDYEVIVIDGGSVDETLEIVKKYPAKVLHDSPGRNPCNLGIEAAQGRIVAFLDDDCVAPAGWVNDIFLSFKNDEVAAVGGPELAPPRSEYWPRCFDAVRQLEKKFLLRWGPVEQLCTCNIAYKKDVLSRVGGFADWLFAGEETELNWRLFRGGWRLLFNPELGVYHNRRTSLRRYLAQQINTGLGAGRMLRMHPSFFKPSHLGLIALLGTFAITAWLLIARRFDTVEQLTIFLSVVVTLTSMYGGFIAKEAKLIPGIILASILLAAARCIGFIGGLAMPLKRIRYR